jgi:2-oxoacid:acceptor oxidoreductase gamma subunit (pyruvate/2-ketoisovalerate family)/2-oxoacid:acceptor oxidoreductase delta subunit (pyruvate/2-ketoisovalerate family)
MITDSPRENAILMEIRFHGRGGQGAVTGVRLLSTALYYEGKYTLGIPMYGTERRGAPVQSFLRISDDRIYERDLVHEPDMVVVLDPLLAKTVPVTQGLKKGGLVLVNHPHSGLETGIGGPFKVATVDATKVAMETIGRPITNTAILGAFAKVTGMVKLSSLEEAAHHQWSGRIGEMNIKAMQKAYEAATPAVDVSKVKMEDVQLEQRARKAGERDVSSWRLFRPVFNDTKCIGCRRCYILCPEVAIGMTNNKATVNYQYCKGCGICYEECPTKAIEWVQETI